MDGESTYVTVLGRKFIIEVTKGGQRLVFVDAARDYAKVAVVTVTAELAADYPRLEGVFRTIARSIIKRYREQYEILPYRIEFLEGAELKPQERAKRVGLVIDGRHKETSLKLAPAPKRR